MSSGGKIRIGNEKEENGKSKERGKMKGKLKLKFKMNAKRAKVKKGVCMRSELTYCGRGKIIFTAERRRIYGFRADL